MKRNWHNRLHFPSPSVTEKAAGKQRPRKVKCSCAPKEKNRFSHKFNTTADLSVGGVKSANDVAKSLLDSNPGHEALGPEEAKLLAQEWTDLSDRQVEAYCDRLCPNLNADEEMGLCINCGVERSKSRESDK